MEIEDAAFAIKLLKDFILDEYTKAFQPGDPDDYIAGEAAFNTCEAIDIAVIALNKMDKYRWHDLHKNPDDVPKDARQVIVAYDICDYDIAEYWGDGELWGQQPSKIIAWKYIEGTDTADD